MTEPTANPWEAQRTAMGVFIRTQRELANLSLRQLSQATQVSNAYLSQIERGLHDPTIRVLVQIGKALQLSVEEILGEGMDGEKDAAHDGRMGVESAVRTDPYLTPKEKEALLSVYRSYVRLAPATPDESDPAETEATTPAGDKR